MYADNYWRVGSALIAGQRMTKRQLNTVYPIAISNFTAGHLNIFPLPGWNASFHEYR